MKSQVNPVTAGIVVVVLIAIVGLFLWKSGGVSRSSEKPPGMPAEAGAALGNVMSNKDKTAPAQGSSSPTGSLSTTGTMPMAPPSPK